MSKPVFFFVFGFDIIGKPKSPESPESSQSPESPQSPELSDKPELPDSNGSLTYHV